MGSIASVVVTIAEDGDRLAGLEIADQEEADKVWSMIRQRVRDQLADLFGRSVVIGAVATSDMIAEDEVMIGQVGPYDAEVQEVAGAAVRDAVGACIANVVRERV